MKSYLVFVISIFLMAQTWAGGGQIVEKDEPHYYTLGTDMMVAEYSLIKDEIVDNGKKAIGLAGAKFNLVKIVLDSNGTVIRYVIKFWDYRSAIDSTRIYRIDALMKEEKDEKKRSELEMERSQWLVETKAKTDNEKKFVSSDDNGIYFYIDPVYFKEPYVLKTYYCWHQNISPSVGTLVVPIKMRPVMFGVPFDFTTDFSLGASIGVKSRMTKFTANYISLVAVFGMTTINVDENTTNGYVSETTKLSGFTPGWGIILELNGFQVGLVNGYDYLGGKAGQNWVYNKKGWWSFGIGYEFLTEKENKQTKAI